MGELWTALQTSDLAAWVGFSRWGYAMVATVHVASIAVLFGSILIFDLRLMGLGRALDQERLSRLILPAAGTGLVCAVVSGFLLFAGRAATYSGQELFQIKMALILLGVIAVIIAHVRHGLRLQRATPWQCFRIGLTSIVIWLSVLVSGRMIAFVHG